MSEQSVNNGKALQVLESVTIRFAGDSGDGMQLTGTQFTNTSAFMGNDISTLPDYPAEIRAPAGSLGGVSGFQLNFSSKDIHTPGDTPNVLVAMNPAALKVNLADVEEGGIIIVNEDAFNKSNLEKAGYKDNPLDDETLTGYRVFKLPISSMTNQALKDLGMSKKETDRCKNFFALGVMYWLFDRPLEPSLEWIGNKFKKNPTVAEANATSLKSGYYFADTAELFTTHYKIQKAELKPGRYRKITGNEATAIGLVAASKLAGMDLFYGSYPITPASEILQDLAALRRYGVRTFQAEDEIAAICATVGASFTGNLAATGTSGPGVALKNETLGLAVMTELPLIIVNVQRGGPSTGLPTKTEQADLLQALYGRNGECPMPVLAASSPADCFHMAIEAARIALKYMTPVFLLTDGYIANGAEPLMIPAWDELPKLDPKLVVRPEGYAPYKRDEKTLARPYAIPGTPHLEHRIGGLEKEDVTGNVSYDSMNHEKMVRLRQAKIDGIANDIADLETHGEPEGDLLILGWGGTYGHILSAADLLIQRGRKVSCATMRHLNPMPKNTESVLKRFKHVLIPELNNGQLRTLIQGRFEIKTLGLNKIQGKPFKTTEIVNKVEAILEGGNQ